MSRAFITSSPIDTAALIASVSVPAHGAVSLFLGIVREENDSRAVRGMRYDAYEQMALDVLSEIVRRAEKDMGEGSVVAVHRTGELSVGDVSVAIAVGAPHRAPVYEASRFVIEEIKKRLPVWKQEHYIDGNIAWLDGAVPPVNS